MLSDDELEILEKKYKLSGCKSLRQFIMKCILEKDIFVLDMDVFRDMSTSISRISSNIIKNGFYCSISTKIVTKRQLNKISPANVVKRNKKCKFVPICH